MSRMAKVASEVEISDVQCIAFEARRDIDLSSQGMCVEYVWKTHTSGDSKAKHITVFVEFEMLAAPEGCGDGEKPIQIKAVLALTYDCEEVSSFDDSALEAFGKINGVYNAWPYWREFVQNTVARMGLPPLIVPTFRVIQSKTPKKASRPARKKVAAAKKKIGSKVS